MITITPSNTGFSQHAPPPVVGNMAIPPPNFNRPPHPHPNVPRNAWPRNNFFRPFTPYIRGPPAALDPEFDGKRLRKSAMRKTVDYNSAIIKMLESRVWQRDFRDRRALQPDVTYLPDLQPPPAYEDNAINAVTTRFVKAATNKMRCPIFCMAWTPEGRRLVTGASSGEFTLWNGLTFNFETILQAHDTPVRTMVWSHNDVWMVTADHAGYVKYWQSNMNNVKMFLAHKEAVRGISFSPNDSKFATCSDDGTVRIWDFQRCQEEKILRGHGADVKCVHWHPQKSLIISGSKDNQQPVKLWDPKSGQSLATLHAHKSTVMDIKWNNNGNWVVTASRDHLLKLFDIRKLSEEMQVFRGHKKESSSVAWHPYHEGLFCSGGSDGAILFWHVGADKEVGAIEQAHDSIVWTLAWHPLGHILASGSNDHSSKFWTRNRPGDLMRDKYNLNTLPANMAGLDDNEIDDLSVIPGMGPEDKIDTSDQTSESAMMIPGLDIDLSDDKNKLPIKKVPYSKPIPKNFQAHWNHSTVIEDDNDGFDAMELINQLIVNQPGVIPLADVEPETIVIYGKTIELKPEDELTQAIKKGSEALARFINSGAVEELNDVRPYIDLSDEDKPKPEPDNDNDDSNTADNANASDEDFHEDNEHSQDDSDFQDQDMRQLMMKPPPNFPGLGEGRLLPPPPPPPQGDERPPRPGRFNYPRLPPGSFSGPPPQGDFHDNMYRGNDNEQFRPNFGNRGRGSLPPFRGRNQGFHNEDTRSGFNQQDDQDMGYGNNSYNEEEEGEWNNEGYRDNYDNGSGWNEKGMEEEEPMEEEYYNGDQRYQPQSYPQRKFQRPPRSRGGGMRGQGRGFDRGRGRGMRSRGRGGPGPRGGFKPRGRNPRR